MVFEAVVVDVLNRVLGNYVENLDTSQLTIGIWAGDVVLENLIFKINALEQLDIPVQTVYGHLGKMVLKIPWNNLYGASTEASIENLFLIVNPSAEVPYNASKEEKALLEYKRAELARVEEAKMREMQKDQEHDTFVEKLTTQIIKNVQLDIVDIHVRYEDSTTNPDAPFSCGMTLHNLSVHTTDEDWNLTVVQEMTTKIYKILTLQCLAVYWNPTTEMYSKIEKSEIIPRLQKDIATKASTPESYHYILGPINAEAKLKLNPKPEADEPQFSIPKCIVNLNMELLMISITKAQYHDLMKLVDSMARMTIGAPYRKYRPFLSSYKGHYKEWWIFAYTCILEEDIRREKRNWDWEHMKSYRLLCKEYAEAHQTRLSNRGKVSPQLRETLKRAETKLDILNLVIIRQQVELEVARLGQQQEEMIKNRGWFGGWVGGRAPKDDDDDEDNTDVDIVTDMSPEEKAQLYRAIDYQENVGPIHLPDEYISLDADFRLERLQVTVTDDGKQVLSAEVDDMQVQVRQRPGADAIRVDIVMFEFRLLGVTQRGLVPKLASSRDLSDENLLVIMFETNPLSGDCGQRVQVSAEPLLIIYDAQTIIEMVNVFKPLDDESTAAVELYEATGHKLSELKDMSALGMQHAVSQHTFIDIDVDMAASRIIVPHGGFYTGKESILVVRLGSIRIKSEPRSEEEHEVQHMFQEGLTEEEILQRVIETTYDKVHLEFILVQAVVSGPHEDWVGAILGNKPTRLHLLQPTTLSIQVHRCLLTDDPRLPRMKIMGEVELMAFKASENRLANFLDVIYSIPLPESDEPVKPVELAMNPESRLSRVALYKYVEPTERTKDTERRKAAANELLLFTDLEAVFLMKELTVTIYRKKQSEIIEDDRLLHFSLKTLEVTVTQTTFTLETVVRLRSIALDHFRPGFRTINIMETPQVRENVGQGDDEYLFTVTYSSVDRKCPGFRSRYESVEQLIVLDFATLKLLLHLEGLKQLQVVIDGFQQRIDNLHRVNNLNVASAKSLRELPTIVKAEVPKVAKSKVPISEPRKRRLLETVKLKVKVKLEAVSIRLETNRRPLADACVLGLNVGLVMKPSYTQVDCSLQDITIVDLNPLTIHTQILTVVGGDVIDLRVVMYNLEEFPDISDTDVSIVAQVHCLRFIYLNWFLTSVTTFASNFQAAEQAIIDASAAAADSALTNMESAYESATKVSVKVQLSAPVIFVPEHSRSRYAVVVDLGHICIHNNLLELKVEESRNHTVTVDEITLAVEKLKVSTARLSLDDREVDKERVLLRPTSFNLLVKRSLSSWYGLLPDLDISGRLRTIAITIGENDFKIIMRVLHQNMIEGLLTVPEPVHAQRPATTPKRTKRSHASEVKALARMHEKLAAEGEIVRRTTTKFLFSMDSLVINLMNTTGADSLSEDMSETDVGLARFCLTLLSLKGRMLSDHSMFASVLLVDCTLDDMRPARGDRITRYLQRRYRNSGEESVNNNLEPSETTRRMIDIGYTFKDNDSFMDMRIFSLNLIMAMDFLMKVLGFLMPELGQFDANPEAEGEAAPLVKTRQNQAQAKNENAVAKKAVPVAAAVVLPFSMTVAIKLEMPDIILVESLEDKGCDALIMSMEVTFRQRSTEEQTVMEGAVSGLRVEARAGWGVGGRAGGGGGGEPPRYLLEPCDVSLATAQPVDSGMHADVAMSGIRINLSPGIVHLLNRVLVTATMSPDNEVDDEKNKTFVYEDLWGMKPFTQNTYWFLKSEIAKKKRATASAHPKPPSNEICLLTSPAMVLSLEIYSGAVAMPMLVMQAALTVQIRDWSSEMTVDMTLPMQVMYYNVARAVWEPLFEPNEVFEDAQYKYVPWNLKIEVVMRGEEPTSDTDSTDDVPVFAQAPPYMSVLVASEEPLEITVTETCMAVLTQLGNVFSAAIADEILSFVPGWSRSISESKYAGAPYVLHNCTGVAAQVRLQDGDDFAVFRKRGGANAPARSAPMVGDAVLRPGESIALQLRILGTLNLVTLEDNLPQLKLCIKMTELKEELLIAVERADKRYFPLGGGGVGEKARPTGTASRPWGLISEVTVHDGAINIYLRSVVQLRNRMSVPACVYYMPSGGNQVSLLGEVAPGEVLRMSLQAAHAPTSELFFAVDEFNMTVSPFVWREIEPDVELSKLLQCDSKDKRTEEKFYIMVVGSREEVFLEDSNRHTLASSCYNIVLLPAVKLQNCLPVDVLVSQSGSKKTKLFKPGEMFPLPHLAPHAATVVVVMENYMNKAWMCTQKLPDLYTELSVWSLDSRGDPAVLTLDLGMHNVNEEGTQALSLYCPFWMLNKTGQMLAYRSHADWNNVQIHRATNLSPVLFSYRPKNFFGKKKASIRVEFGEWSEKFSLDVAGSSGVVLCKNEGRLYQVGVTNQLTFNSLTKMVIFTPFFLIINECPFPIECQELDKSADVWLKVERKSSKALWPSTEGKEKLLAVRVSGTTASTRPFLYTEQHTTTLKLDSEYGGLHVETQLSEGGTYITLRQYRDGLAPALIINYSPYTITLYEKENVNVRNLNSMFNMLYSWENPGGPRMLIFKGLKREMENDLRKDGTGKLTISSSNQVIWVSFLDGLQRVILFTDNEPLAQGLYTAGEMGRLDTELSLSMRSVGLSLVNDAAHQEILYCSIYNSGIIWQQRKVGSRRYRKIDETKMCQLEEAYQRYKAQCLEGKEQVTSLVQLDDKTEVDFAEMQQLRPAIRFLHRTLEPGLRASYCTSAHVVRVHARLHRLQLDQQLPLPTFPVVFAPIPPPRTVAMERHAGMKPFIELSIVERVMEHSKVRQYKYYKILVQEFHVKVDMGLINALMEMFPQKALTEKEALELFAADLQAAARPLDAVAAEVAASDQKHFYDMLHLSPLKVHLSFSLGSSRTVPTFVGTLVQTIGSTLTDMNDVIFKLAYYERTYEFISQNELISQTTSHYTGQALKQLYVLVLGLDVIGNPYGLVIGLKKGVEDLFYEPIQGAIQGPGEFAEGVYLGVRSLVGHTVGGAAGAVSRIAGAMGRGLATLSLDKDYQNRRQENINKPPASLPEGLARSGKDLVVGVFDGVAGVFTKPLSGAREQGVGGFFKGLGKGAVGLVARPAAAVADFTSGSLGAVQRAVSVREEVTRRRPTRKLHANSAVRPYSLSQAEGYQLLSELEKENVAANDVYAAHVWVVPGREVAVCTDMRLLYLEKNMVFGGWQISWSYLWSEVPEAPSIVANGVFVPTARPGDPGTSAGSGKLIRMQDEQLKEYIRAECGRLIANSR